MAPLINLILQEIDVVGEGDSTHSHRKKLSAFTIESILSGMADIKVQNFLNKTSFPPIMPSKFEFNYFSMYRYINHIILLVGIIISCVYC